MAGGQNGDVTAVVALGRTDVADAAVVVLDVVPAHEFGLFICNTSGGMDMFGGGGAKTGDY